MNDRIHPGMEPMYAEPMPFDEFNPDHLEEVCGKALAKPIGDLLATLWEIEATAQTFGADKAKVADAVIPELKALKAKCKEAWRDL